MTNKNTIAFGVSVLVIIFIIILGIRSVSKEDDWICQNGQWVKHGNPSVPAPLVGCGEIKNENNTENLDTNSDTENTAGDNSDASQPADQNNIIVTEPKADEVVGLPLIIKGNARVYENTVNFRIKNSDGKILMENSAIAKSPDVGQFGPFEISINYPDPEKERGTVEIFQYSAKDGSELDKVEIPITFKKVETGDVKIFFGNRKEDPDAQDCSHVYSASRRIPKTNMIATETIKELLNGTTVKEEDDGFFSEINPNVKLQKISISGGTATVDFSKELSDSLDGSDCTLNTIKAQIAETLKQFPTVKDVKITVDGKEVKLFLKNN